jgi:septal ring factor EnvC (AmiA/AmiB activator)
MEGSGVNMDVFIIIMEAMGGIMVLLIGALSFFYIQDRRMMFSNLKQAAELINKRIDKAEQRDDKLELYIKAQQKQITELTTQMKETLLTINVNQQQDQKRLGFMEELITTKLRAASGL